MNIQVIYSLATKDANLQQIEARRKEKGIANLNLSNKNKKQNLFYVVCCENPLPFFLIGNVPQVMSSID